MSRHSIPWLIALCALTSHCRNRPPTPPESSLRASTPLQDVVPVISPSAPDVSVLAYGTDAASVTPPKPAASVSAVDLVHAFALELKVSSKADHGPSLPDHLVDGDPATAWNSRSGDLEGAWIEVSVPPDARVDEIRMTAGFTRQTPKEDSFVLNPRVRRVRVARNSVPLGEFDLDIASRELQSLPVHSNGGRIRVTFLAMESGTKPVAHASCVSEFQVRGLLPQGVVAATTPPIVRVDVPAVIAAAEVVETIAITGHPGKPETLTSRGTFPTVTAYCSDKMRGKNDELCTQVEEEGGAIVCQCGPMNESHGVLTPMPEMRSAIETPVGQILGAMIVPSSLSPETTIACALLVQVPGGWVVVDDIATCGVGARMNGDRERMSVKTFTAQLDAAGASVLHLEWFTLSSEMTSEMSSTPARCSAFEMNCTVTPTNTLQCLRTRRGTIHCAQFPETF